MTSAITRMQFLRGDIRGKKNIIRPPWSLPEDVFIETCSGCKKCIGSCPEKILIKGRGNLPEVDFSQGECSFCGLCVEQCSDSALINYGGSSSPWRIKAQVKENCLTHQGIICVTCQEQCEPGAIKMKHQLGMVAIPQINLTLCSGCGACFQPCPANAITLKSSELTVELSMGKKL